MSGRCFLGETPEAEIQKAAWGKKVTLGSTLSMELGLLEAGIAQLSPQSLAPCFLGQDVSS